MLPIPTLRLAAQQLTTTTLASPAEMVAHLGAVQAQDVNMAKWAIGLRLPNCNLATVTEACNRGEILRTHVLRPTWHFVAPADIRWMLSLSKDRIKAQFQVRDSDLGLDDKIYTKSNKVITKALEGGRHLLREELAALLKKAKINADEGRITHIMMNAEIEGLVCSGAMRGKQQTYALLDEWVPPVKMPIKEEALACLALRYFTGHGPATPQDCVWWSGLTATNIRQGLRLVCKQLTCEKIEGKEYWFSPSISKGCTLDKTPSCFLLPAWDEYLVGYKDRSAVLHNDYQRTAIVVNGTFRPVVIYNGQVIGIWKKSTRKDEMVVAEYFKKPTKKQEQAVAAAAQKLGKFWREA
ncbi:MAG: winged helix DNA-binding domain-containing protein [Prevotellaceae bacterium]|jgi:hypothetical protein|nr:winged helix DNA-binding domain-containing protein [Prevotellaceae bacterium]